MDYFNADRAAEDERLLARSRLFDPLTRRLLEAVGLAPGMRVLDPGSGAGNVARLAAELVGPDGAVVGVEKDPEAVEFARRHTDAPNVEFRVADAQTLYGIEGGFDAVTGRLILLHLPDPVGALREAAARVRPGGLVIMHECDLGYLWASPQPALWGQVRAWLLEAAEKAGIEPRLGPALFSLYREAGLPGPRLLVEALAEGGPDAPAWGWANVVSAMAPLMEKLGVATRGGREPADAGGPAAGGGSRMRRLRHLPAVSPAPGRSGHDRRCPGQGGAGRRAIRPTSRSRPAPAGSGRRARRHGAGISVEHVADRAAGAGRAGGHQRHHHLRAGRRANRTCPAAFNLPARDPVSVAEALNRTGVESRAGYHCAARAHHALGAYPAGQLPALAES